jgi:hypothetical protein
MTLVVRHEWGFSAECRALGDSLQKAWALLRKPGGGRSLSFPGQAYSARCVKGVPVALPARPRDKAAKLQRAAVHIRGAEQTTQGLSL